jgi:hypothetical protein
MSDVAKKIMAKLKEKHIEIIPKWRFILKRLFIWGSLVIAIVLGAFSVSMVMFQLIRVDWDILPRVMPMPPDFGLFRVLPYFWMLISALLFTFVYFDFKNTRKGHRYGGGMIVGGSLLIAFILGTGIYYLKTPEHADEFFLKIPIYKDMHRGQGDFWNVPEHGVLVGTVMKIDDDNVFILEDITKHVWAINIEKAHFGRESAEKIIVVGNPLMVLGKPAETEGEFMADEVRPFRGPRF